MNQAVATSEELKSEGLDEKEVMATFAELSAATAHFEEASLVGDAVRLAITRIRLERVMHFCFVSSEKSL